MNEEKIIEMYKNGRYTLRHLSEIFGTNHHKIKRILIKNGVKITRRKTLKKVSPKRIKELRDECKGREGFSGWNKGKKMPKILLYKNMKVHLKYNVSIEWLNSFEDIEKLKYLNHSMTRERDKKGFNTEIYKKFIEKFYKDDKFNKLFDEWIKTKNKWIKPSLDHIQAKSKGGTLLLDNLQFISWLENRAKIDIPQVEWDKMKKNIQYYFI